MVKSYWLGGGPCDSSVSPSPFGLDFGTLDFGTLDLGLTIFLPIFPLSPFQVDWGLGFTRSCRCVVGV